MKKKRRNGQPEAWVADQVLQSKPYSKRLLEVIKMGLLFAALVYALLLAFQLLTSIGSWNLRSLLDMQRLNLWISGGCFVLTVISAFPRRMKSALQPEQLRFEDGMLRFRLAGKDVELTSSKILGVSQHFFRDSHGITSWFSVYEVRTAQEIYRIDLDNYEENNAVVNWLLRCNRQRNAEKVHRWRAAKQAFRTSDRVTFGKRRRRIVFEQQPPSITLGTKQLDLSAISRIVIDPTVGGRGGSSIHIAFLQHNGKEKTISSRSLRTIEGEWDSFLQHLFATAKRVNVPVELKTDDRRDVSQGD
ncbi:hypothetical protein [Paenibacillus sp. GCM10027626]|uniref:hypothetical protein n=1 Tax=Paenibacillus sp. GCM10027626 TaxID=3273411 RepID=UPI0036299BF5